MKQKIQDALLGEIYFKEEDIKDILMRDMIYEPEMEKYFPEMIANVKNAFNSITHLVDEHINHKLNHYPYTWDNSELHLQVDSISSLVNANYPSGQQLAVEMNDRLNICLYNDIQKKQVYCTVAIKPYRDYNINVFDFTYDDENGLKSGLITFLYLLYNGTLMCDIGKEVILIDNITLGYQLGKELGDNCFILLGSLKSMLKISAPELKSYVLSRIKSHISKYETVTEVYPDIKYKDGKPYLEYR